MDDLRSRLANRVQLSTDGHKAYLHAVMDAFGGDVDYAQLVKLYGETTEQERRRYSPSRCIGIRKNPVVGTPNMDELSTSYVERHNLTMRMSMRRFTRHIEPSASVGHSTLEWLVPGLSPRQLAPPQAVPRCPVRIC